MITLLVEHILQVADFTLYLPACFFRRPAIAQLWIPCRFAGLFFDFALRFLESTLNFILCARFHKNKIALYERAGCKWFAASHSSPILAARWLFRAYPILGITVNDLVRFNHSVRELLLS